MNKFKTSNNAFVASMVVVFVLDIVTRTIYSQESGGGRKLNTPLGVLLAIFVLLSLSSSAAAQTPQPEPPWGPETPNFNLEVILRGEGFGRVKFRQPNDEAFIVYLDTWLRDLAPNTTYLLQRAVDTNVDDNCTSTAWLTLGKGLLPQSIMTDAIGAGREKLFRNLPALPGSEFDIHFRVIEEGTSAVVLTSKCYQFTISQ